jgi:hypothetical protein
MPDLSAVTPLEIAIFAAVFAWLAAGVLATPKHRQRWQGRRWQPGPARSTPSAPRAFTHPSDPAEQLRAVMAGSFTAKRVLSGSEARVMRAAEAAIAQAGLPWRVLAQVALGEVLASPDEAAFRAVNAKRVDLLIVSAKHEPLAAIEYQGQGHWQGTAPARDAVKKEALRKAGIRFVEITPDHGPADVAREIERLAMTVTGVTEMRRLTGGVAGAA